MEKTIYMMCGVPGSGKSTWVRGKTKNAPTTSLVVSTDAIRKEMYGDEATQGNGNLVFNIAYERIEKALAEDSRIKEIYFDATNLHQRDRKYFVNRFRREGVKIALVYVKTPYWDCIKRNKNRERVVPESVISRMWHTKDIPSLDEDFDIFITVHN